MPVSKRRYTIIRVWTSEYNEVTPGQDVGHVSLQTQNDYMSLWPDFMRRQSPGMFKPIPHELKPNYEADLAAEGRKPEHVLILYSLNVAAIEKEFKSIANRIDGWALVGGMLLLNGNSAESCASMAYKLLDAGGIEQLVPGKSSRCSSPHSPDELARVVVEAKNVELQEYEGQDIKTFSVDGVEETQLPSINPKAGLECKIM